MKMFRTLTFQSFASVVWAIPRPNWLRWKGWCARTRRDARLYVSKYPRCVCMCVRVCVCERACFRTAGRTCVPKPHTLNLNPKP